MRFSYSAFHYWHCTLADENYKIIMPNKKLYIWLF